MDEDQTSDDSDEHEAERPVDKNVFAGRDSDFSSEQSSDRNNDDKKDVARKSDDEQESYVTAPRHGDPSSDTLEAEAEGQLEVQESEPPRKGLRSTTRSAAAPAQPPALKAAAMKATPAKATRSKAARSKAAPKKAALAKATTSKAAPKKAALTKATTSKAPPKKAQAPKRKHGDDGDDGDDDDEDNQRPLKKFRGPLPPNLKDALDVKMIPKQEWNIVHMRMKRRVDSKKDIKNRYQYYVKWGDSWVPESHVAAESLRDWNEGRDNEVHKLYDSKAHGEVEINMRDLGPWRRRGVFLNGGVEEALKEVMEEIKPEGRYRLETLREHRKLIATLIEQYDAHIKKAEKVKAKGQIYEDSESSEESLSDEDENNPGAGGKKAKRTTAGRTGRTQSDYFTAGTMTNNRSGNKAAGSRHAAAATKRGKDPKVQAGPSKRGGATIGQSSPKSIRRGSTISISSEDPDYTGDDTRDDSEADAPQSTKHNYRLSKLSEAKNRRRGAKAVEDSESSSEDELFTPGKQAKKDDKSNAATQARDGCDSAPITLAWGHTASSGDDDSHSEGPSTTAIGGKHPNTGRTANAGKGRTADREA
jgi:hypothetical protein